MHRFFLQALAGFLATASLCAEPAQLLQKASVLPLQLDDAIKFRKTKTFMADPERWKPTQDSMLNFERQRVFFGAVTSFDRLQRYGQYYTFFWRADRPADLTMRFEYRQENLGTYVQAQERSYTHAKGSNQSKFAVTGD